MEKRAYIETYGCQMNVNDTEVIFAILARAAYARTENMEEAQLIMANTCSIRDNAEQRIWGRLEVFDQQRKARPGTLVGIMGCMDAIGIMGIMGCMDAIGIVGIMGCIAGCCPAGFGASADSEQGLSRFHLQKLHAAGGAGGPVS